MHRSFVNVLAAEASLGPLWGPLGMGSLKAQAVGSRVSVIFVLSGRVKRACP